MQSKYKKALVLLNMGGPRNKEELELFLRNMFNDKNILTMKSDLLRSMIASLIVYSRKNSAWENYEAIGGESPINGLTQQLIDKLQSQLPETYVTQAMRYTPPFAAKCVEQIKQQGIEEVTLLPLYPQYSTTTTKSSVEDFVERANNQFKLKVIEPFYENQTYNQAIIESIKKQINSSNDYNLIFSAHGLPQKIVDKGDPYEKEVKAHVALLSQLLQQEGYSFESINLAYQSKVGPLKWLEPSLESMLEKFKDKKVLIYPIAFIIDNSETDFELAIEYKEVAEDLGIKEYKVCPCVNDSDLFIEAIKELI
ncbi:ferrochelatase [Candidatus Marinarcus aquaticus]|uniref:Ferrochelatase n=1 Tax=Candidatus Marinarcus aquaticus TaxID=2044504 RepID=A0A4Q0XT60_9BACT|nr:ferrochelatase [Candidatus Marinarcus aquaticus]RXJ60522.1 ferrochelatase [Candidatus Marinarcus aquaticus]